MSVFDPSAQRPVYSSLQKWAAHALEFKPQPGDFVALAKNFYLKLFEESMAELAVLPDRRQLYARNGKFLFMQAREDIAAHDPIVNDFEVDEVEPTVGADAIAQERSAFDGALCVARVITQSYALAETVQSCGVSPADQADGAACFFNPVARHVERHKPSSAPLQPVVESELSPSPWRR